MSDIDYLRIYSDSDGCSHFEEKKIGLDTKDYAPPAPPLYTSTIESADNSVFLGSYLLVGTEIGIQPQ